MDISSPQPEVFSDILIKEASNATDHLHSLHHLVDVSINKPEDCFLFSKKQNSRRSMLSTSSGETDKDLFTFSSLSNYTNMTIDEEENVSDLNRQIEELHNQLSATQERNKHLEATWSSAQKNYTDSVQHLLEIQTTQDELVNVLECRYAQVQNQYTKTVSQLVRDFQRLDMEKHQWPQILAVIEKMLSKQDQKSSKAVEGLEHIKLKWSSQEEDTEDIEIEQANFLRAQRDRFYHQWKQQAQQSEKSQRSLEQQLQNNKKLDRKIKDLESDLKISQELLKQQDASGRIHTLEIEIGKIRQHNRREQETFEKSQRGSQNEINSLKQTLAQQTDTIRSLQSTTRILHQQLSNSIDKKEAELGPKTLQCNSSNISLVSTYGDTDLIALKEKIEQEEKIESLRLENAQLKNNLKDIEWQTSNERLHLAQKIKTLEASHHHSRRNSQEAFDCRRTSLQKHNSTGSSKSCSRSMSNSSIQPLPLLTPASPRQDKHMFTTTREDSLGHLGLRLQRQQSDITTLTDQQLLSDQKLKSATDQLDRMDKKLKEETELRLKAEKTRRILEKKYEEAMNKKSKYSCF